MARSGIAARNLRVLRTSTSADVLTVGGNGSDPTLPENETYKSIRFYVASSLTVFAGVPSTGDAGIFVIAPGSIGATGTGATARYVLLAPNAVLGPTSYAVPSYDPLRGGIGIELQVDQVTAPTLAPTSGYFRRSNPSNHHPEVLLPGDDPSSGWRDLLASAGAETTVNVTSATPGDIAITSATKVVNLNATDCRPTGFTAPTTPAAGVISVTNSNSTSAVINANAGGTAANGVAVYGSGSPTFYNYVEIPQYASVVFSYDYNAARWIPAIGGSVSGA